MATAIAPGSGTSFIFSNGTYDARPALACIALVASAPDAAAAAPACSMASIEPPLAALMASAAGMSASSIVR